jgi:mRNA-degrading endonuclease HigB of HigAB toxin-antitoxin module
MLLRQLLGKKFNIFYCLSLILLVLLFFNGSCKSPENPDDLPIDETSSIKITNDYGEDLDIYMDGVFIFVINNNETKTIEDVSIGEHQLIGNRVNTNIQLASLKIDISSVGEYTWYIDDPADINVQNFSGYDLSIYMDNEFMFNLADEENRFILDVTHEKHYLKANKISDGSEYASITIEVTENKDYLWTIN